MSDEVQYSTDWSDPATQCQNCKLFQAKDGHNGCVPPDKTFEEALEAYGEASPTGHCDMFQAK
jgi:hypothetical protein